MNAIVVYQFSCHISYIVPSSFTKSHVESYTRNKFMGNLYVYILRHRRLGLTDTYSLSAMDQDHNTGCTGCTGCNHCTNCTDCTNSDHCTNSERLVNSHHCTNSQDLKNCSHCTNCSNLEGVDHATNQHGTPSIKEKV
jgi:hypothetical protein